jgi:hypothetical protein
MRTNFRDVAEGGFLGMMFTYRLDRESRRFSHRLQMLGSNLLTQEILGFGFLIVPLLQLLGAKKVDDALTNRVAICNDLANDVGFGCVGILMNILCNLFPRFRKSDAKLFVLDVRGQIDIAITSFVFREPAPKVLR